MRRLTVASRGMLIAASCSVHAIAQEQLFPPPEVGGRIEIEKIFDVGFLGACGFDSVT